MTGGESVEVHHAVPGCLLRLRAAAGDAGSARPTSPAWLEFEVEARRWGVSVEIAVEDLEGLVESSTKLLDLEAHRMLHGSDWQRWGARGGRETVRRYGSSWMALLALRRWGRISAEDLDATRVVR